MMTASYSRLGKLGKPAAVSAAARGRDGLLPGTPTARVACHSACGRPPRYRSPDGGGDPGPGPIGRMRNELNSSATPTAAGVRPTVHTLPPSSPSDTPLRKIGIAMPTNNVTIAPAH